MATLVAASDIKKVKGPVYEVLKDFQYITTGIFLKKGEYFTTDDGVTGLLHRGFIKHCSKAPKPVTPKAPEPAPKPFKVEFKERPIPVTPKDCDGSEKIHTKVKTSRDYKKGLTVEDMELPSVFPLSGDDLRKYTPAGRAHDLKAEAANNIKSLTQAIADKGSRKVKNIEVKIKDDELVEMAEQLSELRKDKKIKIEGRKAKTLTTVKKGSKTSQTEKVSECLEEKTTKQPFVIEKETK